MGVILLMLLNVLSITLLQELNLNIMLPNITIGRIIAPIFAQTQGWDDIYDKLRLC